MLPRVNRLSARQVANIMKNGRVIHSPLFIMRYVIGTGDARYSGIIPKKVGKTAVSRSTGRRKIYEAISSIPSYKKFDANVVLVAKTSILTSEGLSINKDIHDLFVKAKILV